MFITYTESTIYTRDRLLSLSNKAAVLRPDNCLLTTNLGLCLCGCHAGSHKRWRLQAASNV